MGGDVESPVMAMVSMLLKLPLAIGGLLVGLVGLLGGNLVIVGAGAVMFILSRVIHAMDQRALDRQTQRWSYEVLGSMAPIPPRHVRMRLLRSSAQIEGVRGDIKHRFQMECHAWAADHSTADGGRATDATR